GSAHAAAVPQSSTLAQDGTGPQPDSQGTPSTTPAYRTPLPGMPPLLDPADVYAADRPGRLAPQVAHDPALVYVPNFGSGTVTVINPRTYRVLRTVRVGKGPQHV